MLEDFNFSFEPTFMKDGAGQVCFHLLLMLVLSFLCRGLGAELVFRMRNHKKVAFLDRVMALFLLLSM